MSETFLAWDGVEYPEPPPDDWTLRTDGRWWPEGSGPSEPTSNLEMPARSSAVPPVPVPAALTPAIPPVPVPGTISRGSDSDWNPAGNAFEPQLVAKPRTDVPPFVFDGGAGTYLGTAVLATLVIVCTLGIATPFALVLLERWKAKHTFIEGRRLIFTGTGRGLFGQWIVWLLLMFITLGIYSFWVFPRLTKWKIEHLAFDPQG